jgi:hypothetical protein
MEFKLKRVSRKVQFFYNLTGAGVAETDLFALDGSRVLPLKPRKLFPQKFRTLSSGLF